MIIQYLVERNVGAFSAARQSLVVPLHHFGAGQAGDGVVVSLLLLLVFRARTRSRTPGATRSGLSFVEGTLLTAQTLLRKFAFGGGLGWDDC